MVIYQLIAYPNIVQFGEEMVSRLKRINVVFLFSLFVVLPLLFASALKQNYPLGYAGLYTQMAAEIANLNFHLPLSVPFYGPGGIPFAYPPLALYLMAVFIKLGVSVWSYLRFAPPVLSWLSLIPLFILAKRISRSNLGGLVAVVLAASSYDLFDMQTTSGGIVRALAFGLGLLALYFFDRMVETFRWRDAVLAGVFFGLTALAHLGYAYFFAFWIGVWVVTHPRRQNWMGAGVVVVVSLIVTMPWIMVMLERYGVSIFVNAFPSHGSTSFISLIQNPANLMPVLINNLSAVLEQPWFLGLVLAGLICLFSQKKFTLPLLFLIVSILIPDNRYILMVSFLVAGYVLSFLYTSITSSKFITNKPLEKLISSIAIVGIFTPIYLQSFNRMSSTLPSVNQEMLGMASFIKKNTPPQASYQNLFWDANEAEWLPYLMQRNPVIAPWGGEWIGTYETQFALIAEVSRCKQDLACLEEKLISAGRLPDMLIILTSQKEWSAALSRNPKWQEVYANSSFIVWESR
jgi:asparagine N-glycosylation enzyme membrane subunit Stt3